MIGRYAKLVLLQAEGFFDVSFYKVAVSGFFDIFFRNGDHYLKSVVFRGFGRFYRFKPINKF